MMPLVETPYAFRFVCMILCALLLIATIFLLVWQVWQKFRWYFCVFSGILNTLSYFLLQILRSCSITLTGGRIEEKMLKSAGELPTLFVILFLGFLISASIILYFRSEHYRSSHINRSSLEESFDGLPIGICVYYEEGAIRLFNPVMREIAYQTTKKIMRDGREFWKTISTGDVTEGNTVIQTGDAPIIKISDGRVFSFSKGSLESKTGKMVEILSLDITEEYQGTMLLEKRQAKVLELNNRLKEYSKNVTETIREKEILEAKVRIHDELGKTLVMTRQYLQNENGDKEALLSILRKNAALLREEHHEEAENPENAYQSLLSIAEKAGISIHKIGEIPVMNPAKHLFTAAFSEFLTNTYRHTKGKNIDIYLVDEENKIRMQFLNDGEVPEKVLETGGLKNLRKLVEDHGGEMQIHLDTHMMLQIEIQKGIENGL